MSTGEYFVAKVGLVNHRDPETLHSVVIELDVYDREDSPPF